VIRDIRRKIANNEALKERFADLLALAVPVRFQDRGPKVYALHAPRSNASAMAKPGCRTSSAARVLVATPATKPKGGQFVLHAKALHGDPFDGHTLGPVVAELEALTGIETRGKGYRGHNHAQKFRVWISGQVRRVTAPIRRQMRRRAAVEPVIGHLKAEHRMGRNHLKGRHGNRCNAVLAAAGYNFGLLPRWSRGFRLPSSVPYSPTLAASKPPKESSSTVLHGRLIGIGTVGE